MENGGTVNSMAMCVYVRWNPAWFGEVSVQGTSSYSASSEGDQTCPSSALPVKNHAFHHAGFQ